MAIDFSRADVDADVGGSLDGYSELSEAQMVAKGWSDPRAAAVGYWRIPDDRMPRGRITLSQCGINAYERTRRDYVELTKYGTFKSNGGPGSWQPWRDPWLGIVQSRRNGLAEFDAQQIIDLGWHRRPKRSDHESHKQIWRKIDDLMERGLDERAALDRVFPQLVGIEFTDVGCGLCPGRVFANTDLLHRHESIVHKEAVASRQTREAISLAVSEAGGDNAKLMAVITEAIAALARNAAQAEAPKRARGAKPEPSSGDDAE